MAEVSELWSLIQSHLDQYGVTDAEFARRMGVSPQTLNSWKKRGVRKLPDRDKLESVSELTRNTYAHVLDAALVDSGYKDVLRDELVEIGQRVRDLDDPASWDAIRDLVAELLDAYYLQAAERRPKLSELISGSPRRKADPPATPEDTEDQASPIEKTIPRWSGRIDKTLPRANMVPPTPGSTPDTLAASAPQGESLAHAERKPQDLTGNAHPHGPDRWPDGQPVYDEHWDQWKAWQVAGAPENLWEAFLALEPQKAYDLAARFIPGPTDKERMTTAQDQAAEAPDADGDEAGA